MILVIAIIFVIYIIKHFLKKPKVILQQQLLTNTHAHVHVAEPQYTQEYEDTEIVSKCYELSHSHADIGTVTPIEVYSSKFCIIPYQSARIDAQKDIATKLRMLNPDISRDYILENWKGSDVMYVIISGNLCIGSVAVDRKNFEPFISHLYVDVDYRKKGYGKRLLEHGIEYARSFKFNTVKLWCEEAMVPYYLSHGWTKDNYTPEGLCIMKYSL